MYHTNQYAIHYVYYNYLHNKLLGYLPSGKISLSLKRYSPLELFFCAHSQFDCSTMFQCRVSLVLIDHYEAGIEPATHYHNLHQRAELNGILLIPYLYSILYRYRIILLYAVATTNPKLVFLSVYKIIEDFLTFGI